MSTFAEAAPINKARKTDCGVMSLVRNPSGAALHDSFVLCQRAEAPDRIRYNPEKPSPPSARASLRLRPLAPEQDNRFRLAALFGDHST
jgi:hypothetical protein